MSTRSIIGTANDGGFAGRYCHWDGYPTCRARQILATYRECDNDWETALAYAMRPATPGYWSSYMTPSQAETEAAKPAMVECWLCHGTGTRPDMVVHNGCNGCAGTGIAVNRERHDGYRTDNGDSWATDTDTWGAEWAYLLDEQGIVIVAPDMRNGWQATGGWRRAGFIAWDIDPDIEEVELERIETSVYADVSDDDSEVTA